MKSARFYNDHEFLPTLEERGFGLKLGKMVEKNLKNILKIKIQLILNILEANFN